MYLSRGHAGAITSYPAVMSFITITPIGFLMSCITSSQRSTESRRNLKAKTGNRKQANDAIRDDRLKLALLSATKYSHMSEIQFAPLRIRIVHTRHELCIRDTLKQNLSILEFLKMHLRVLVSKRRGDHTSREYV